MKTFSVNEALNLGWALFKKNKKTLALAALVYLVVTNAQNLDMVFPELPLVLRYCVILLFFVLSTFVQIGWYKLLLRVLDGSTVRLEELFHHGRLFFRYLVAVILYGLIVALPVAVGALLGFGAFSISLVWAGLLAVPVALISISVSIYLAIRYNFVLVLIIDKEEMGIKEAFRVSTEMTKGLKWKLLGLGLVVFLVSVLGAIIFIVGVLATLPTAILAYLSVYRKLLPSETPSI